MSQSRRKEKRPKLLKSTESNDVIISTNTKNTRRSFWELPEVILYHIVGFVAPPTHRASVLCHQIAPLCKSAKVTILEDEQRSASLWDAVLTGDYGVQKSQQSSSARRSCKRLRRSPCHRVADAHRLMISNSEIAFFYLSELAHTSTKKELLSKAKLCGILNEYGPILRLNNRVSSGGTYLVEVCRARNLRENVIKLCVEELVERRGALVNVSTFEEKNSSLTALCVAAVRGMPQVVKYLLQHGASNNIKCSGRFRLSIDSRRSVRCTNATPLEFASAMVQAELDKGATERDISQLRKCISLLEDARQKEET